MEETRRCRSAERHQGPFAGPTSRFIQDYNTLQFNSLSISYDFPAKLVKRWGLGMLRLTANMEDLGYFSSVLQERGLDYPYSRTVNFTLNLTF